ncbi:MAG: hypothetical protein HY255_10525 [Betaproteobacteria bacterium]|nr:hypothetical protein [Betaproteobacteria bacterium]
MRYLLGLLAMLAPSFCLSAEATFGALVLLQPESVLEQRGISVQEFAKFVKTAQAITTEAWREPQLPKSSGFLVLAVRSGGKINAWLDMEPALPREIETKTLKLLRSQTGFAVSSGTIVFAIKTSLPGAIESARQTPFPAEWKAALQSKGNPVEIENLVNLVWP